MCYSWFQLPKVTLNEQLSSVLSGDIPESILLINTAEWQGQVRREVYFNSLLGAIPRMINVCVFSTQKQVKRFPSVVCRFLQLAMISFTFNSAFRSSNIWFSFMYFYSVLWSIFISLSPSRLIWIQFENEKSSAFDCQWSSSPWDGHLMTISCRRFSKILTFDPPLYTT